MTFKLTTKFYKVKLVSQASSIALIIVLITTFFVTRLTLVPETVSSTFTIVVVSVSAIISYLLWQKFVTGRTVWTITEDDLTIQWTKRPLERTKDLNLRWTEIAKISQGSDRHYYHLKIDLTSDDRISFFHDPLTTKDDFEELVKMLHQKVK